MIAFFTELSNRLDWDYRFQEYVDVEPYTVHAFQLSHQGVPIEIEYEFGRYDLANFTCSFISRTRLFSFTTTKKSHFWKLFHPRQSILQVQSPNVGFGRQIHDFLGKNGLLYLAEEHLFAPYIHGKASGQSYQLNTRFHLAFNRKEQSLEHMVSCYKDMIDLYSLKK